MEYVEFLKSVELAIDRRLLGNDVLSSIELIIVINHFNDIMDVDYSVVDFLQDSSFINIYNIYFQKRNL